MPRGKKTDKKKEIEIMTSYAFTNSYLATAKEFGISHSTVRDIIDRNYDDFVKIQQEKKQDFISRATKIVDKMTQLLDRRVTRALDKDEEIENVINEIENAPEDKEEEGYLSRKEKMDLVKKLNKISINSMNEITTSLGTVYDKIKNTEDTPSATPVVKIEIKDNTNLEKVLYEED